MHIDRTQGLRTLLERRILIMDGAMGTMIQQHKLDEAAYRGARFADFAHDVKGNNELLTLTQPTLVGKIHEQYLAAGADIIETNTFGATSIAQADYHLEGFAADGAAAISAPPGAAALVCAKAAHVLPPVN